MQVAIKSIGGFVKEIPIIDGKHLLEKEARLKEVAHFVLGVKTNSSNNLPTMFPEIAKEWDYSKNENIDINSMHHGSETKVWWKCNKGPRS